MLTPIQLTGRAVALWLCLGIGITLVCCDNTTVRYLDVDNGNDSPGCLVGGSDTNACQSLSYALTALTTDRVSNLHLLILPGVYYYGNSSIRPLRPSNIFIQKAPGYSDELEVIFRCSAPLVDLSASFTNLEFIQGINITVQGITVEECGPRESGIFVRGTDGINFVNCIFKNNTGSGLWIQQCLNVEVHNCQFMNNAGYSVEPDFSIRSFAPGGMSVIFLANNGSYVKLSSCTFFNNAATITTQDNIPRAYTPSAIGDGGALIVRFSDQTNNSRVEIIDCIFLNNSADDIGGAIYVPMIEGSENNTFIVSNTTFENSRANVTGGAVAIDMFDVGDGNFVEFLDSKFLGNEAASGGGGISFVLEDSLAQTGLDRSATGSAGTVTASFRGCTFEGNSSPRGGAALGLISNARVDQPPMTAVFTDCTFAHNTADTRESAVFIFRFPAVFAGSNLFKENEGGGLTIVSSRLHSQGNLTFVGNSAEEGAGMTLVDQTLINLITGTRITFSGNTALAVGGAIVVRNPSVNLDIRKNSLYNHLCFIQFEAEKEGTQTLTPREWENVSVKFFNNTAGHAGAAIYASDLGRCVFTSRDCPAENVSELNEFQRSIFQETPFTFKNNTVLNKKGASEGYIHRIATEPSVLTVEPDKTTNAPGDVIQYLINAKDQSGNPRQGVWRFEDDDFEQLSNAQSVFQYFSIPDESKTHEEAFRVAVYNETLCAEGSQQEAVKVTGRTQRLEFFIIQASSGDVVYETITEINVSCCHPGYFYDSSSKTCRFDTTNRDPNILRADGNNRHVFIQPNYYAGFYEDPFTDEAYFTTTLVPSVFLNCTQEGSRTGCLYVDSQPNDQCGDSREGYMCGKCPEGQGVDLTLGKCRKCTAGDAVGLLIICLLIVVFCFVVLAFNIGLPNDLKGFLFYAQVVGFVYLHGAQEFSWDFHLSRLFGFSLYLPICPFTSLPTLWTVAFGFLPSILATITVVTYVICARFIRSLSTRTVFNGLWFIFLFVYKYMADTTSNVLKCVRVEGNAVKEREYFRLAYFYDGNVPCFAGEHLILAIPSLILLVLVVILGPILVIVISFRRFKRTQPFTDVITEGVSRSCRWWSGFDLLRRLMFIVVVTICDFALPDYTQLFLCFTSLVVLAVLCATKPYEDFKVNVIEGLILLDLLLIALHFLNESEYRKESTRHSEFIIFLLLLPFLYLVINISIRIALILWQRYVPMDPRKIKYWAHNRPHNPMTIEKSKPLLTLKRPSLNADTIELSTSHQASPPSSGSHGNTDETWFHGEEGEHDDVAYTALREELLGEL